MKTGYRRLICIIKVLFKSWLLRRDFNIFYQQMLMNQILKEHVMAAHQHQRSIKLELCMAKMVISCLHVQVYVNLYLNVFVLGSQRKRSTSPSSCSSSRSTSGSSPIASRCSPSSPIYILYFNSFIYLRHKKNIAWTKLTYPLIINFNAFFKIPK